MKEIWKDIPNYGSMYQASNFGRIKNKKFNKILKQRQTEKGYLIVSLHYKKTTIRKVHRLIALSFIPNTDNKPFINHKDGNKQNNCIDNLEWVTCSENMYHSYKMNLHKTKKVIQYDLSGNFIKKWSSINEASNKTQITRTNISNTCANRRKSAGGYIWKYDD